MRIATNQASQIATAGDHNYRPSYFIEQPQPQPVDNQNKKCCSKRCRNICIGFGVFFGVITIALIIYIIMVSESQCFRGCQRVCYSKSQTECRFYCWSVCWRAQFSKCPEHGQEICTFILLDKTVRFLGS